MYRNSQVLRVGLFFDGTHVSISQNEWPKYDDGHLDFDNFKEILKDHVYKCEDARFSIDITYAGWFQGLSKSLWNSETQSEVKEMKAALNRLVRERNRFFSVINAGIETTFFEKARGKSDENGDSKRPKEHEKGVDVALAIAATNLASEQLIDYAIIITVDGDFVPLVHNLKKKGIRVLVAGFEYENKKRVSMISRRLKKEANHSLNMFEFGDKIFGTKK